LLEIFREYTEKGKIQTTSKIIASQVANLETATRQIETKARALAKAPIPTNTQQIQPNPPTYANRANSGPRVAIPSL